jgi:beta-lactamase superfamily II metal-dependent hydrolase
MRRLASALAAAAALSAALGAGCASAPAAPPARTLDIYFIDVEGGKATLVVTPSRESLLIDAGFPGSGTFNSTPGDPAQARDAQRVLSAARAAGLARNDHLLVSHYHADHFGGVMELAQLLPVAEYIDHARPSAEAEARVPGTLALYDAYVALRAKARHRAAKAGDRFAVGDATVDVVASDGAVLPAPLAGAGAPNPACTTGGVPAQETTENPLSTAVLLRFGAFRYLDVGDLSGAPLYALTCPVNRLGPADVYAIAHHGGDDGSDPSLFAAVQPRAAVFSNGTRKGAQAATLATLRQLGIAGWQLHRTENPGAENAPEARIANLDTTTSAWIKLSARRDGSFTITNGRTGQTTSYATR